MRIIETNQITEKIAELCVEANCRLGEDAVNALKAAEAAEQTPLGKNILANLLKNAEIADTENVPICQDTGMAVFFAEIGQEVFVNGNIERAIEQGVRKGYTEGYLRASVVEDPLRRKNTRDNTPPVVHYSFAEGDRIKITFAPKGFGSENMSALTMLKPSQGRQGVIDFVIETVKKAGASPCPPIVVGVGIGGTMEKSAILSKQALTRDIGGRNPDEYYAQMEEELLSKVNALGIGPQGFGGSVTALAVHIQACPTHIAGLPVAVNINCHVARHKTIYI